MPTDVSVTLPQAAATKRKASNGSQRTFPLHFLLALLALQAISATFFLGELWTEVLGLRTTPIPYEYQEIIQVLASFALVTGVITTFAFIRRTQRDMARMQRQIDVASGNYVSQLQSLYEEWGLSQSERDVTTYVMKGFSNAEVAELRGTSPATVKSQLNSIYRKSGCANRQQLISFLVEDMLSGLIVD